MRSDDEVICLFVYVVYLLKYILISSYKVVTYSHADICQSNKHKSAYSMRIIEPFLSDHILVFLNLGESKKPGCQRINLATCFPPLVALKSIRGNRQSCQ